MDFLKDL